MFHPPGFYRPARLPVSDRPLCDRAIASVHASLSQRCEPWTCATALTNAAALDGKVAMCGRGDCGFVDKARACQMAGAVAMIVVNTEDALGKLVGKGDDIAIPCACIKSSDGDKFKSDSLATFRM